MQIFTFVWRVESDGDFFEQEWAGKDLKAAKARWRHYWNLRQRDCVVFEVRLSTNHIQPDSAE